MAEAKDAAEAVLDADAATAEAMTPHTDSLPVRLLEHVADLGDQPQMRALCGSVVALGLIRRDRYLAFTGLRMLAAHTVATWVKNFVKERVDRTRPNALHKPDKDHRPERGRSSDKEETSFPSGHSAGAGAVAAAYARAYPEHAGPALAGGAALALAQIPRCAHYPSDVGAGLAIGLAAEALTERAFRFAEERLDRF